MRRADKAKRSGEETQLSCSLNTTQRPLCLYKRVTRSERGNFGHPVS